MHTFLTAVSIGCARLPGSTTKNSARISTSCASQAVVELPEHKRHRCRFLKQILATLGKLTQPPAAFQPAPLAKYPDSKSCFSHYFSAMHQLPFRAATRTLVSSVLFIGLLLLPMLEATAFNTTPCWLPKDVVPEDDLTATDTSSNAPLLLGTAVQAATQPRHDRMLRGGRQREEASVAGAATNAKYLPRQEVRSERNERDDHSRTRHEESLQRSLEQGSRPPMQISGVQDEVEEYGGQDTSFWPGIQGHPLPSTLKQKAVRQLSEASDRLVVCNWISQAPASWQVLNWDDAGYCPNTNLGVASPSYNGIPADPSTSEITELNVCCRDLSGNLPATWSSLSKIQELSLRHNNLSGSLPIAWSGLTSLTRLRLFDNSVSGTLPPDWSDLSNMVWLELGRNEISGPVPEDLGSFSMLQWLEMSHNGLSGPLPSTWSSLSSLTYLQLDSNRISSSLPATWSTLTDLTGLLLYNNGLSGFLPPSWGNLGNLQWLFLGFNGLNGTLPPFWSSLRGLTGLYLHNNGLSGSLPAVWSSMSNLANLWLHNNGLFGSLPASWSKLSSLTALYLSNNAGLSGTSNCDTSFLRRILDFPRGELLDLCRHSSPLLVADVRRYNSGRVECANEATSLVAPWYIFVR